MNNPLTTKLYYSISEVAEIAGLQPYTLRAWEKEFSCLRPRRIRGKNRAYRERDIRVVLLIKRLLYEERYTVKGASLKLKNEPELVHHAAEQPTPSGPGRANPPAAAPGRASGADQEQVEGTAGAGAGAAPVSPPSPSSPDAPDQVPGDDLASLKKLIEGTRRELSEVLRMLR